MSFDAGALIFKIQTAGYQTFEQQMDSADRKVQQVGRSGAEAAPKVEKTGTAIEQTGRQAQSARAPLEENAKSTKKVGDESASAAPKQDKQKYSTEQQADAAKKLSTALTLTGVAIAAVVGLSVAKWTEFDQAMSNTSAAVMATAQEQKTLSEAALQAGADTAYSATEAANAQEELAKAGMEVSDIVGGSLNGALALAAAGQLQVARSAEIMATTLKQYKLPAEQAAHVSDVLAAGAGKAQGSVDDLALALSYVGPVAAGLGISLEETGGSLAYLASQGILGEKAGTGLRGVLMSLTAPSKVATETMGQYGIEIFDAHGNMKSLAEVSQILKARLGGLTEAERSAALGRIFGNEQITTARILYEGGASAIEDWTDKVNDSGYAAEQAAMRQDNLAGDVEKLGGAFDTALIRTGSGANDVLREMVQSVTALVDWYGELPAPVQATALDMKSLAEVSQILKARLGGLTEAERSAALGRIFGNEQITTARILYEGGASAIEDWTDKVNDSGYAAEQAAMRQDNLAGDVEKLGGAFDTALIRTGSGANDVLREMVQSVTALVDWYGELPAPVQATALVLGVATAAVALFAGAAIGLRAKFAELKAQLDATNVSMGKTALVGVAAGLALTGIVTVVALLAQKQAEARAKAEAYADALEAGGDAARKLAEANLQVDKTLLWVNFGNAYDNADKLGISLDLVTDAASGNTAAMKELNSILDVATGGGVAAQEMADKLGISLLDLSQSAGTLREQVAEETSAQERATQLREQATRAAERNETSVASAADAYMEAAGNTSDLNDELQKLIDTINEANGVGQDAISKNIDYRDALAGVDETIQKAREGVEGYALSLDQGTQVGRDNMAMLVDMAKSAQDAAGAQFELDSNTDQYRATLEASRQALVDRAQQLGANADEAGSLADQIFRIPSDTEWRMIAETADAKARINDVIQLIDRNSYRTITLNVQTNESQIRFAGGNTASSYADGGVVTYHADGSENHAAQIARAGEWRVWAEPETGGESYIPHALSKRGRADQIMAQTASILGGTYIPAGASTFAQGSPVSGSQGSSSIEALADRIVAALFARPAVQITEVNPVHRDPMSEAWQDAQWKGLL